MRENLAKGPTPQILLIRNGRFRATLWQPPFPLNYQYMQGVHSSSGGGSYREKIPRDTQLKTHNPSSSSGLTWQIDMVVANALLSLSLYWSDWRGTPLFLNSFVAWAIHVLRRCGKTPMFYLIGTISYCTYAFSMVSNPIIVWDFQCYFIYILKILYD